MDKKKKIKTISLNDETYTKLFQFCTKHEFIISDVLEQIILDDKIEVENRTIGETIKESKKFGKKNDMKYSFYLGPKAIEKLKNTKIKLSLKRNEKVSESEIVREKIKNADLTMYKFKKRGEK